ncbi:MAG TPA: hypothetical protein VM345_00895 [Acidimicrobiales bacterium]|nr:hypothetical protein [Acidimicrobiales bacterium]
METTSQERGRIGTVMLWTALVVLVVVGGMFFAVGATNSGDTRTGGFMVALPAAALCALCLWALSRRRTS